MSKILRLALCSEIDSTQTLTGLHETNNNQAEVNSEDKTIKMTGPLSEVYTKALQIVYSKEVDKEAESGMMAIESQVNDAFMQVATKKALLLRESNILTNEYKDLNNIYVYTANATELDNTKALSAINDITINSQLNPNDTSILVVDGGEDKDNTFNTLAPFGSSEPAIVTVREATEHLCNKLGIELYYSLEAFVNSLQKK